MKICTPIILLKKLGGLSLCLYFSATCAYAQQALTLEQSLDLARQHNVNLRQASYNASKSTINLRSTQFAYLPTIGARADVSRVNGLTFDNVQGQVKRGNTTSSNPYISAQLVLFEGFSKFFELKRARKEAEANTYLLEQAQIDMEATVTGHFLQAILDRENARIARERISLLESQVNQIAKLEKAGVRTEGDVYQLKSQLATEKLNLITHENSYRQSLMLLSQAMNSGADTNYDLQTPTAMVDINESLPAFEEVLNKVVAGSPLLKASEATLAASKQNLNVVRSSLSPTLSLNGIIGSNFSSNIMQPDSENKIFTQIPYFEQLDQNQQKIVQLSLSIPVFNGFRNHFLSQNAKLDLRNAELDYIAAENTLRQTIQQAYQDVLAAQEKYNTVVANLEYSQKAFEAAKRKYELGLVDFFSYMESLNNKSRVEAELLQSKCEFYFKYRILTLYQG